MRTVIRIIKKKKIPRHSILENNFTKSKVKLHAFRPRSTFFTIVSKWYARYMLVIVHVVEISKIRDHRNCKEICNGRNASLYLGWRCSVFIHAATKGIKILFTVLHYKSKVY